MRGLHAGGKGGRRRHRYEVDALLVLGIGSVGHCPCDCRLPAALSRPVDMLEEQLHAVGPLGGTGGKQRIAPTSIHVLEARWQCGGAGAEDQLDQRRMARIA